MPGSGRTARRVFSARPIRLCSKEECAMQAFTLGQIELLPWYAIAIVWAVAALWIKPDKATEPLGARLFNVICIGFALMLLFSRSLPTGALHRRFVTFSASLERLGIALTYMGSALAIWARLILGENWSSRVNLKVGHQLIRSGPYAYVRHPIYGGFLL